MNMSGPVVKRTALLIICASIVLWRSAMFAQQPQVSDMLQKYGQTSAPRDFEGTLYCIRCTLSPTPENLATCDREGHAHFLLMEDGHMHPLYGIDKATADKINSKELYEKKVKIRGVFYPASNAILVGDVRPAAQ
jgi:hypothetical protein